MASAGAKAAPQGLGVGYEASICYGNGIKGRHYDCRGDDLTDLIVKVVVDHFWSDQFQQIQ